jgi:plasmid stability protein
MPSVTIRNLPEETHRALKLRAACNGTVEQRPWNQFQEIRESSVP